jgi:hypothetical protein
MDSRRLSALSNVLSSKRGTCYHAISRDLSCRPDEILKFKTKELSLKSIATHRYSSILGSSS